MPISRRKTLALIGGGTILAASGASAAFLTTRTPGTALAPWDNAGQYADPRKRALSYALLAPNPHNLQPWLVGLEGNDTVSLWHDTSRRLPHTDPFDRQLVIGFGCFLELMRIAASADGYAVETDLFPDGPDGPIARAVFRSGDTPDPLAAQIMDRRSCKEPFEMRAVEADKVAALEPFARIITDAPTVNALRTLTWDAWVAEMETPRTLMESVDLMRFGKAEINANPDGIDLGGPFLDTMILFGLVGRDVQADPNSTGFQQGVKIYNEMLSQTPAYVVDVADGNTREDQIAAGARWVRLNLKTTELGLSLQPVSQCLQEYPEMAEHYAKVHDMFATDGQTVQMLGRLGYGPTVARTPRWTLEEKLKRTA